ncbi:MAG: hypothetical protein ACK5LJ_06750 [Paracoccus sp. (in: a-proteobacteria)]
MSNEIKELDSAEIDQVSGGFFFGNNANFSTFMNAAFGIIGSLFGGLFSR